MTKTPLNFLPYGRQTIENDDIEAVIDTLKSDFLTTGPKILEFENILAKTVNSQEAIVVGNGTQALHLACLSLNLTKGDYVIVPSVTFLATANAVRYCGADVIFCDVDPQTGLMTAKTLKDAIENNTDKNIKAVIPVHLAGNTVKQQSILDISKRYNLKIISDSCHALGSEYNTHKVGSCNFEDMATFSFHPVKNIAMGEGGAITTNDIVLAEKIRQLRNHGMVPNPQNGPWVYDMVDMGYNYRATDIQCALGISQLHKLNRFIKKRQALVDIYDQLLKPFAPHILPPLRIESCNPAWHLYAPRFDFESLNISRTDFMSALKDKGIGTQVHYIPVHTQPYYKKLYGEKTLTGATKFYNKTLSLPLFPTMTKADIERVILAIKSTLS